MGQAARPPFPFFRKQFILNKIPSNWHVVCMIIVFADDLSTEYNIILVNKNMDGELLMIGFSVQASCFYLKIKDNRLIF